MAARDSSLVGEDTVLLFILPALVGVGRHIILLSKSKAKTDIAANSDEVK